MTQKIALRPTAGRTSTLLAALLCAGCGTFQLASSVTPPEGKSKEQQQLDNLTCKDRAKLEANTTGRQTGAFVLGMTIVGAPVAFEMEKAKQREVFADCMQAMGYRVVPATDDRSQYRGAGPVSNAPVIAAPAASPAPAPAAKPITVSLPATPASAPAVAVASPAASAPAGLARDPAMQLEKLKELHDKGLISDEEYARRRNDILDANFR